MPDNNDQPLVTDPKASWRAAKLIVEKYAKELGVEFSNTHAIHWFSTEVRNVTQGLNLPAQWLTTPAGVLAGTYLQSPKFLAKYFSQFTGLDEGKLDRLFNEGLDAGILSLATRIEQQVNHPPDALNAPQGVKDAINKVIGRMRGEGKFEDLRSDGKKLSPIITQLQWSGDVVAQALANNFLRAYGRANAQQRAVLEDIGQRPVWDRQGVQTALMSSVPEGFVDIDLDVFIHLMSLKESRSRLGRATAFVGAALTGDENNPDFHRVREGVDRMNAGIREDAQRRNKIADQLEGRRYRKPPSARERLAMFGRRLCRSLGL